MTKVKKYPADHQRELVCTLPKGSTKEFLLECQEAGMTQVRVHSGKMGPKAMIALINEAQSAGLKTIMDLGGKKARTKKSPGMAQFSEGPEKGNWCRPVDVGEKVALVPENISDQDIEEMAKELDLPKDAFILRLSYLPNLSGDGNEKLNLADGKIQFLVEDIQKGRDGKALAAKVRVAATKNTEGIFWNMGLNSQKMDLFSGHDSVLTHADREVLKSVCGQASPDQIALSFVSYAEQVLEARQAIEKIGYDLEEIEIDAKVETMPGVENIQGIASLVDVVIVARGDLTDACERAGVDLMETEKRIIEGARKMGTKVIVATNVANSLINRAKQNLPIGKLNRQERVNLTYEWPVCDGLWLAAETMITGKKATQIIRVVKATMAVAERYWKSPKRRSINN